MSEQTVIGTQPWLPWPLAGRRWWTEPVPAERLAALRIGVALVLLVDVLLVYLPRATDFYGPGSLGHAAVFADWRSAPHVNWSLFDVVAQPAGVRGAMILWAAAAGCLLLGVASRFSAGVAWALSVSAFNTNVYIHNAGDVVRTIILFYLMLSPCGAAWAVNAWWRKRHSERTEAVHVHAWPLRLLFLQLVVMYFCNGVFKLTGAQWQQGEVLHYILSDPAQTRWSYVELPLPVVSLQLLTWSVLVWQVSFPLAVCLPWARRPALWMGVLFHLGIGLFVELAMFCFYMLCLYLPLVPWERSAGRRR